MRINWIAYLHLVYAILLSCGGDDENGNSPGGGGPGNGAPSEAVGFTTAEVMKVAKKICWLILNGLTKI